MALKFLKGWSGSHLSPNQRYIDVNVVNEEGNNALHYLFMNFYINPTFAKSIAKCLIKKGININAKNKQDFSPLHLAILSNQHDALLYAIDYNRILRDHFFLRPPQTPTNFPRVLFDFS